MIFDFNDEKNTLLVKTRGVSFEMVIEILKSGASVKIVKSPNKSKHPNQDVFLVEIDGYMCAVPFVKTHDGYYLKTIYASRKFTKLYLSKEDK